jgi:hypothetical protein
MAAYTRLPLADAVSDSSAERKCDQGDNQFHNHLANLINDVGRIAKPPGLEPTALPYRPKRCRGSRKVDGIVRGRTAAVTPRSTEATVTDPHGDRESVFGLTKGDF